MAEQENFGIKINVNTKDATKNLKDLDKEAKKTGEAIEKPHDVNINDKKAITAIDNIERSVGELSNKVGDLISKTDTLFSIGKVTAIIAGITAIGMAAKKVYDMVSDTAHEIVSLGNTAAGMSMTTNNLKAWETSFKAMGFEAKQADQALGAIQDRLTSQVLHPSQQVQAAFGRMGINTYDAKGQQRSAEDVLLDVAKTFKRMNPNMALAYGQDLGLSRDVVMQMRNNPQFAKTLAEQKAKPVVTDQEEKQARDFVAKQADFGSSIDQIKNNALMPLAEVISDQVLPELQKFAQELAKITQQLNKPNTTAATVAESVLQSLGNTTAKYMPFKSTLDAAHSYLQKLPGMSKLGTDWWDKAIDWAQSKIESGGKNQIGYAMTRDKNDKYTYKLDAKGNKIPEAYGIYQIKPSTASEVMKRNVTPEELMDPAFNKQVRDKHMQQLEVKYGSKERALAAYNGDLARYDKTGTTPYIEKMKQQVMQLPTSAITHSATTVNQPTSTQSHAVTNNINNRQMSSTANTTHIATVNVNANNPQEFSNELRRQTSYLDRANTVTGMMA